MMIILLLLSIVGAYGLSVVPTTPVKSVVTPRETTPPSNVSSVRSAEKCNSVAFQVPTISIKGFDRPVRVDRVGFVEHDLFPKFPHIYLNNRTKEVTTTTERHKEYDYYDESDRETSPEPNKKMSDLEAARYEFCNERERNIHLVSFHHPGSRDPPGYELFPGAGSYRYHPKRKTWRSARERCEREGAHLVVVDDSSNPSEMEALLSILRRCGKLTTAFLGYQRKGATWEDVLGDPITLKSVPESGDDMKCLVLVANGGIKPADCLDRHSYICEFE